MLAHALQDAGTEMHVKVSLACFKKKDPEVYRLALEKLDGYEVHSQDFCAGIGCVYSNVKPGVRARCQYAHDFCQWCDADGLVEAKGSIEGRKRLNQALSVFRTHPAVYEAALAKLGKDFVRASRYCGSTGCIFSYRNPGERSRARPQSDLCFWCNPAAVSAAEMTPSGIRRIGMDLRKFSTGRTDVFQAGVSKLSAAFLLDLRVCSLQAEQQAMPKEELVEQHARGRYYS